MANLIASRLHTTGASAWGARARPRASALARLRRRTPGPRSDTGWSARRAAQGAGLLVACAVGAVAEYFFDRDHGARRRHLARDRALATVRRRSRDAVRRGKYLEGVAQGAAYRATHAVPGLAGHKEQPDDVTLAHKVESIAFREAHVPKAHVSINADNGVVYLRGQLDSAEQIDELVRVATGVEGVKGVKNLLHTPEGS